MRILQLKEKHGEQYFDVSTDEKLYAICLEIVTKRENDDFYYFDQTEPAKPTLVEGLSNYLEVDGLPNWAEAAYKAELARYKQDLENYKEQVYEKKLLERALTDGKEAYKFLLNRSQYEYEGIEILELSEHYQC